MVRFKSITSFSNARTATAERLFFSLMDNSVPADIPRRLALYPTDRA